MGEMAGGSMTGVCWPIGRDREDDTGARRDAETLFVFARVRERGVGECRGVRGAGVQGQGAEMQGRGFPKGPEGRSENRLK